jgi:hypothetical protein
LLKRWRQFGFNKKRLRDGGGVYLALEFINDNLILLKVTVVVSLVSDPMVFTGTTQVRTEFIYLFEREFLSNLHLAFLFAPFLIIKFNDP